MITIPTWLAYIVSCFAFVGLVASLTGLAILFVFRDHRPDDDDDL